MPFHDILSTDLSHKLTSAVEAASSDDGVSAKLLREADVFVLGTLSGVKSEAGERLTQPLTVAAEFLAGYGASRGLALLQRRAGFAGLAVQGVAVGLTLLACKDISDASKSAGQIWSETWDSPGNTERSKASVANGFGGYLVDSAITGYGAFRGAKSGYLRNQSKLVNEELLAGNHKGAGVVAVRVGDAGASGFAVDSRHIVTNMHVATAQSGDIGSMLTIRNGSQRLEARVVAIHEKFDVAILDTVENHGLTPLRLASKELTAGSEVVALKRGMGGDLKVAPGPYESSGSTSEWFQRTWKSLNFFQKAESHIKSKLLSAASGSESTTMRSLPSDREMVASRLLGAGHGWSGSPLLDRNTGDVIGVVSGGFYNPTTYRPAHSEPIHAVHDLLAQIARRGV